MFVCVCLWLFIVICVCLCFIVVVYSYMWLFVVVYSSLCLFVVVCGYLCLFVFVCGCLWLFIVICFCLWRVKMAKSDKNGNNILLHFCTNYQIIKFWKKILIYFITSLPPIPPKSPPLHLQPKINSPLVLAYNLEYVLQTILVVCGCLW